MDFSISFVYLDVSFCCVDLMVANTYVPSQEMCKLKNFIRL